jgi:LysR family transcriptional regulator, transcriptional activator of the cysJI operon
MMDIRMTTFLTVAKIKNFTKAGEILSLTQPAVSQHIKFLEEYYGKDLIKKQGRTIGLTEAGEVLFKYAKELDVLYRSLEIDVRNTSGTKKIYNVGATMTIGGYVLPYILGKYKEVYKNTDILLQVNNTEEIISKLLNRCIHFALVEGPFNKNKFNYRKFKDDELVLAVSTKHEFCKRESVELEEIISGRLILREKGSGTRKIFENKLVELGYDLEDMKTYMEIGDISAIKSLVESNLGYTIISREAIKRESKLGVIKIVPIRDIRILREFNFIYLDGLGEEFIDHFINFCNEFIRLS